MSLNLKYCFFDYKPMAVISGKQLRKVEYSISSLPVSLKQDKAYVERYRRHLIASMTGNMGEVLQEMRVKMERSFRKLDFTLKKLNERLFQYPL
ncbi:MAG: hypothetical protein ACFFCS_23290 [Candidatus Hodarchaeota archaeon]